MNLQSAVTRRAALKGLGAAGAAVAALSADTREAASAAAPTYRPQSRSSETSKLLFERVFQTWLIDTHEHLIEEKERLQGAPRPRVPCDDWALLFSHYFKKHIVTAPANKLLPFGGDYIPVEPVLGHAILARRGIALALSELVEERWLKLNDALDLVDPILHGNARQIFRLAEKTETLRRAAWNKPHAAPGS
jgi:hypothetical protein